MYCENCGSELNSGGICPNCAATQHYQNMAAEPNMSKREFYKHRFTQKGLVIAAAVICFISAVMSTLLAAINAYGVGWLMLLDVAIILGLGLGILIGRSRVCAIILAAYALYNTIYSIVAMGQFGGWLIVIGGVLAICGTFMFHKQWAAYSATQAVANDNGPVNGGPTML